MAKTEHGDVPGGGALAGNQSSLLTEELSHQFELWRHYDDRVTSVLQLYATVLGGAIVLSSLQLGQDANGQEVLRVLGIAGAVGWAASGLVALRLMGTQLLKSRCAKTMCELRALAVDGNTSLERIMREAMPPESNNLTALYVCMWIASSVMAGMAGAAAFQQLSSADATSTTVVWGSTVAVISLIVLPLLAKFAKRRMFEYLMPVSGGRR